jgi:hypothetical protein
MLLSSATFVYNCIIKSNAKNQTALLKPNIYFSGFTMEVVFVEDDRVRYFPHVLRPCLVCSLFYSMELTKNMSKLVSLVCNFNSNGSEAAPVFCDRVM